MILSDEPRLKTCTWSIDTVAGIGTGFGYANVEGKSLPIIVIRYGSPIGVTFIGSEEVKFRFLELKNSSIEILTNFLVKLILHNISPKEFIQLIENIAEKAREEGSKEVKQLVRIALGV